MSDFFERQERAIRQSRVLILLTILIVIAVVLSIEIVFAFIFGQPETGVWGFSNLLEWFQTKWAWYLMLLILGVMGVGAIARGGLFSKDLSFKIQERLGATAIPFDTKDPDERRLINIVEEMAIASGVQIPFLFLLKEEMRINAFVAGSRPEFATLTVTEGLLKKLNREEQQGVIAHEFSHLLHADAVINTRLFSIVSGLLGISYFGYQLIYFSLRGGGKKNQLGPAGGFFGAIFIVAGSLGSLAANILKAAISRQREHLADASAVQFTRSRDGLSGALQKIALTPPRLNFDNSMAKEVSYMCIAPMTLHWWEQLFATHPPIEKRIELLGAVPLPPAKPHRSAAEKREAESKDSTTPGSAAFAAGGSSMEAIDPISQAGEMPSGTLLAAQGLLASLGPLTLSALQSGEQIASLLMAQALLEDSSGKAVEKLREINSSLAQKAEGVLPEIEPLGHEARLPLLDLMIPALRSLPDTVVEKKFQQLQEVVSANGKLSSFELCLLVLLRKRTAPPSEVSKASMEELSDEVGVTLSLFLSSNKIPLPPPQELSDRLEKELGIALQWRKGKNLDDYLSALLRLGALSPIDRKKVLAAATAVILHDNIVTATERHLIRCVGIALGAPIPLLFS